MVTRNVARPGASSCEVGLSSIRKYAVTVFDKKKSPYLKAGQKFVQGDILDFDQVRSAAKGFDVAYNFAGLADLNLAMKEPLLTVKLNILGNTHVLEACRAHKVGRFVYASSAYAFSTKGSFYGVSKHSSEKIIEEYGKEFGLKYTIVRYGSVYGERADEQNRIFRLVREAFSTGKITFKGNGDEEREYIHGRDAAALSVKILAPEYESQHVMLTGIERFKYRDLLAMIKEILNDKIKIELLSQNYKGHYLITPYSYHPTTSKKLVNNPYIDMGQGLLEIVANLDREKKR